MDILRLATEKDWEVLNKLCRQVQQLHIAWRPDIFEDTEILYPMEYLLEDIRNQAIYCAVVNDQVVGYVRFCTWSTNGAGSVPGKVLDLDDITIDAEYRHQGIGQRIMSDIKQIARARNVSVNSNSV